MHAVLEAPAGPIAGHDLIPQLVVIREVTTAIATEDGGGNVLGERPELLGQLFELQLLIPLLRDVVHEVENLHASVVVSTADQERFDPQGRAVGTDDALPCRGRGPGPAHERGPHRGRGSHAVGCDELGRGLAEQVCTGSAEDLLDHPVDLEDPGALVEHLDQPVRRREVAGEVRRDFVERDGRELFAVAPDDQNAARACRGRACSACVPCGGATDPHARIRYVPSIGRPGDVSAVRNISAATERSSGWTSSNRSETDWVDSVAPPSSIQPGSGITCASGVEEVHLVVANEGEELVTGRSQALHRFLIGM